jgi:hypothetical protein
MVPAASSEETLRDRMGAVSIQRDRRLGLR